VLWSTSKNTLLTKKNPFEILEQVGKVYFRFSPPDSHKKAKAVPEEGAEEESSGVGIH